MAIVRISVLLSLSILFIGCSSSAMKGDRAYQKRSSASVDSNRSGLEEYEVSERSPERQLAASMGDEVIFDDAVEQFDDIEELAENHSNYKPKRRSASYEMRNGFYRMSSSCRMLSSPGGRKIGTLPRGRKVWVESHNRKWGKVYRKSGEAFISKSCL